MYMYTHTYIHIRVYKYIYMHISDIYTHTLLYIISKVSDLSRG